jgi:hypothetical protein
MKVPAASACPGWGAAPASPGCLKAERPSGRRGSREGRTDGHVLRPWRIGPGLHPQHRSWDPPCPSPWEPPRWAEPIATPRVLSRPEGVSGFVGRANWLCRCDTGQDTRELAQRRGKAGRRPPARGPIPWPAFPIERWDKLLRPCEAIHCGIPGIAGLFRAQLAPVPLFCCEFASPRCRATDHPGSGVSRTSLRHSTCRRTAA